MRRKKKEKREKRKGKREKRKEKREKGKEKREKRKDKRETGAQKERRRICIMKIISSVKYLSIFKFRLKFALF